jgi:hypothetical protein
VTTQRLLDAAATSPPKHQDLALHLARATLQKATSSTSWPNEGRLTTTRCPDRILVRSALTALRLAAARIPVDVTVEELRGMANGRGDLLAEPAELMIGPRRDR